MPFYPCLLWPGDQSDRSKNHESFKAAQEAFSDLNNKVQESVSGIKVTKSFGYQDAETAAFARINQDVFEKNILAAKYNALFDPMVLIFVGLSYLFNLDLWRSFHQSRSVDSGRVGHFYYLSGYVGLAPSSHGLSLQYQPARSCVL